MKGGKQRGRGKGTAGGGRIWLLVNYVACTNYLRVNWHLDLSKRGCTDFNKAAFAKQGKNGMERRVGYARTPLSEITPSERSYIKHASSKVWGRGEAPSPCTPAIRAYALGYRSSVAALAPVSATH